MAITSVFQTEEMGSIPIIRCKTNLGIETYSLSLLGLLAVTSSKGLERRLVVFVGVTVQKMDC